MKPIINTLNEHRIMIVFPILFLLKKKIGRMLLIFSLISIVLTGCFNHFFRSGTLKGVDAATIRRLQSEDKYFILHAANKTMAMNDVKIKDDKIEANLDTLPDYHAKYLHPKTDKPNVIKSKDKRYTLFEVHMYYPGTVDDTSPHFSVPVSAIERVDVYEFDPATTTTNHVLSTVGLALAGAFFITLIIFMITCNCPQVYVDNGKNYEFVSGVYSGSIYASMERTDYLPLPSLQEGNELKLRIANVKNEKQYINRLQLMTVHHREGVKVLADRHGQVFTYAALQSPFTATIDKSTNIQKAIALKDKQTFSFDNSANENGFSNIILGFKKPGDALKGKLVIHAGNSLWSGYIYHRFAEMFGNKYEAWRDQKDKADPREMEQWQKDQALPLLVFIENNGNWEPVDYFAHTGNTATRDMIMEIDVSKVNSEEVRIKLETAFQFWDLDFAGMDFSVNEETNITYLNVSYAMKTANADQKEVLKEKDSKYCELQQDEELVLTFIPPVSNKATNSYFLISTGYYHNTQKYEGNPDLKTLNSFRSKGSFDIYSRQQFATIEESLAKATTTRPPTTKK